MRENGRAGGNVVAQAVAVLEQQALGRKPTPLLRTERPEKPEHKQELDFSSEESEEDIIIDQNQGEEATREEPGRKSGSPLTRSESIGKKLSSRVNGSPRTSSKVTVIAAKLKQNASNFKGLLHDAQEVDALCLDLMSNLQDAITDKQQNGEHINELKKTSRSGFAYVDIKQYENGTYQQDPVVLRRNAEPSNGENRNSSSTTESVYSEDVDESSEETETSSESDSSSSSEERVHIVNEGLETITEEDRPVTASSVRSKEGRLIIVCLSFLLFWFL